MTRNNQLMSLAGAQNSSTHGKELLTYMLYQTAFPVSFSNWSFLSHLELTMPTAKVASIPQRSIFIATDDVNDYCCEVFDNSVRFFSPSIQSSIPARKL